MTASPRPPPRVVIVHNGANPRSTVEFLTNAGLTVATVQEDEDVFGEIVASSPDIIVLDFDCDGPVAELLKSDPRTKHIPLIALIELVNISTSTLLRSDCSSGSMVRSVWPNDLPDRLPPS